VIRGKEHSMAAAGRRFARGFVLLAAVLSAFLCASSVLSQGINDKTGSITVNLRFPNGSSFDTGAVVDLCTFAGTPLGIGTMRGGQVFFTSLPPGRYTIEAVAPGFQKVSEPAEIAQSGERVQVYVTMVPEGGKSPATQNSGPPVLAPAAQRELNKAMEAFRAGKPEDAKKHLDKLTKSAPGNPDVSYIWGMYYAQHQDWPNAKSYWEKAVQIYPRHAFSLAGLGQLAMQNGDMPAAIDYLGRAVEVSPSAWHLHERLAEAYLLNSQYDLSQKQAELAMNLGKERASRAQLILAQALLRQNDAPAAEKTLQTFLTQQPSGPMADQAKHLLEIARHPLTLTPASTTPARASSSASGPASDTSAPSTAAVSAAPAPLPPTISVADLVPPSKWMPPDVDENVPPLEQGVGCPLPQIQQETAKRVREFVDAVNRITATEVLEHESIDRFGFPGAREQRKYAYVASLEETRPGMYTVQEYRNGTTGLDIFPGGLATLGLPSLVMIFHPAFSDEYDVSCEGLSRWHGGLAWQLHFRQRPDKPARLREYNVGRSVFPISLRGRAWIAADTFQVVSLETDIIAPIPQIRLNAEHISVDYMPVKFQKYNEELWLPQSAELFFDFGGRRMHRRHQFSNYLLFSVDEKQKISEPTAADANSAPAPISPSPNF
jgi:Flp pilus assembly protein TadD